MITTNSITQTYNRSILETHMSGKDAISLSFAVPDHPWVDTEEGAAVRVGMTVGVRGPGAGLLIEVTSEAGDEVTLRQRHGVINADLSVGVNIVGVTRLRSNLGLAFRGVTLVGPGFVVSAEQAETLGRSRVPSYQRLIRPLRNGRDFTDRPRRVFALDLFGMSLVDVQKDAPELYQWLLDRVKPMRDQVERASYRELWWIFAEPRRTFRSAATGLGRFIASVMTASHRVFHFVSSDVLCDQGLITIADDDAFTLAVLSSHVHICWSLGEGSGPW